MKKKIIKHDDWHMEETDYVEIESSRTPLLLTQREVIRARGRWLIEHEDEIVFKLREK